MIWAQKSYVWKDVSFQAWKWNSKNFFFFQLQYSTGEKNLNKINYCLGRDFIFLFGSFLEWKMLNWSIDLRSEISFV